MTPQDKNKKSDDLLAGDNLKKIGIGSVIVAFATLLTAFINYGGLQIIENYWSQRSAPSPPESPQEPAPSPAAPAANPPIAIQPEPSPIAPPASPSESPVSSNPPNSAQPETSVETNNFLFNLQNCSRDHKTIVCTFLITSQDADRSLYLYQRTRMIDLEGNEYISQGLRLGSAVEESSVRSTLAAGVPLKARVAFIEVPEQVTQIPLVELAAASDFKFFNAQFHSVVIQGK